MCRMVTKLAQIPDPNTPLVERISPELNRCLSIAFKKIRKGGELSLDFIDHDFGLFAGTVLNPKSMKEWITGELEEVHKRNLRLYGTKRN